MTVKADAQPSPGPATLQITITNGTSISDVIDLAASSLASVAMPAAWDAANLTFQGSVDGLTFNNVYDASGNEYSVTAAAGRHIILSLADFLGIRYLKIRSGTAGVPVNQTADRALTLTLAH